MAAHPDVLIVGGGVIGLTTAYFLARAGAAVQVVDQADFGQEASWAGAGILSPGNRAAACKPIDQLHALSVNLLPTLSSELQERTGIDNGYRRCGGLELGHPGDDEWRRAGTIIEPLDESAARQKEPALAAGLGPAFFLPDMAQVRNPWHLQALRCACEQLGVTLRANCPTHGFERQGAQLTAVQTSAGPISAGKFLIAAGAWSDGLLEPFGCRPGIRPIRGQIALLHTDAPALRSILMMGKRYLVPRSDGRLLVGSTEEDAGFDKRTTAQGIAELLGFATMLVPILGNAPLERCWAGLRPGSPDGLPFLGPVPGVANLYVSAGHFRSGIQLSAGSALLMQQLLLEQPLTLAVEAFRLGR